MFVRTQILFLNKNQNSYSEYEFITDENYQRRSDSGLEQIVSDIEILSQSDYVICTASSNVCLNFLHCL